jgi:hypothetical protein
MGICPLAGVKVGQGVRVAFKAEEVSEPVSTNQEQEHAKRTSVRIMAKPRFVRDESG